MKPLIVQLVGDHCVGGIKFTTNGLVNSSLNTEFEFRVLPINVDRPNFIRLLLQADVIMCSQASRLKCLPSLVLLKLLNSHAKIIVREHHYSQSYEQFHVSSLHRFHLMLKLTYSLADRVVAVSQAQSEWMLRNSLVCPNKLTVIRQCVVLKDLLDIAAKPIETPLILASYGRFNCQKGFDVLLQAMKLIPHLPIKLRLGGEGSQIKELKQLAQGLENIKFVGCVNEVPKFLQASDVVVIPSRWEPWGNVCLEAKAAGKPVIASDVDGLPEQVQNCGLLIPPDNPEALAEAIEQVVSLPHTQLQTWGSNGRESVRGSWDRYLSQWKTFLWEVLEK